MACGNEITVDGIKYRACTPNGNRCVIQMDRSWTFAGDIEEKDGRIYLTRVLWVFSWSEIGLDGVIANPKSNRVRLRPWADMSLPADVELFRMPVSADWGL